MSPLVGVAARPARQLALPVAIALGFGLLAVALGRGSDLPAHVFRVELFREQGFTTWNAFWYGGHHTPSYSLLFPPLGALVGVPIAGLASAAVATVCFDRLLRAHVGARALLGSVLFAAGTVSNLAVGRLPFALGTALGLGALLAARHRRLGLAVVLAVLTPLASPVAGAFLALAWCAWAIGARWPAAAWLTGATAVPLVVVALGWPEGGMFPFRWGRFVLTLALCGAVALAARHERVLRVGAGLYALAAAAAFVVPTPLGGNLTRLGMYVAGPLLLALGARRVLLAAALPVLMWWQWAPAVDAVSQAPSDPSTAEAYYAPLVEFLTERGPLDGRVEIPFTRRHWETAYVAPHVPIARGWERQIDIERNELFYDGTLTAASYRAWLLDNAVRFVALPDAELDPAGEDEAALLRGGVPGLSMVWSDAHWRVWRVDGSTGLVEGAARVMQADADALELWATAPGRVVVRVRWSAHWAAEGATCLAETPDGWTRLDVAEPGRVRLHQTLDGGVVCDP